MGSGWEGRARQSRDVTSVFRPVMIETPSGEDGPAFCQESRAKGSLRSHRPPFGRKKRMSNIQPKVRRCASSSLQHSFSFQICPPDARAAPQPDSAPKPRGLPAQHRRVTRASRACPLASGPASRIAVPSLRLASCWQRCSAVPSVTSPERGTT